MKKPVITSTKSTTKHVNVLVYGESGIGKTVLGATAPGPLILSAEGGLMSLRDKDIPVIEITSRKECDDIYDWLVGSNEPKKNYQTIEIDSLSEVAEVLLSDELKNNKDPRKAYGLMADDMAVLARGYRDIPYHTYFTCKSKKVVDETTGTITYMPSVPGQKFLNDLPYIFDLVGRMNFIKYEGQQFRVIETEGSRRFVAKDRSGDLAKQEKPDLTHIFNKILGH